MGPIQQDWYKPGKVPKVMRQKVKESDLSEQSKECLGQKLVKA